MGVICGLQLRYANLIFLLGSSCLRREGESTIKKNEWCQSIGIMGKLNVHSDVSLTKQAEKANACR